MNSNQTSEHRNKVRRKVPAFCCLSLASAITVAALTSSAPVLADEACMEVECARQEATIATTFRLNPYLRASDIQVTVENGKATLTGEVHEDIHSELAYEIARGTNGIDEVDNQLIVTADGDPEEDRPGRLQQYAEVVDDATLVATVKSKLLWSRHAEGLDTNVEAHRGAVTLSGTAGSEEARELAAELAANTRGVSSVDNQITIEADTRNDVAVTDADAADSRNESADTEERSFGQDIADTWITTKVKSTYMMSRNVSGSDISVTTENGVVRLSGKVRSGPEHDLAIELAGNIRGVTSVDASQLTQ